MSDSDSDDEATKLRARQMRECVQLDSLANSLAQKTPNPAAEAATRAEKERAAAAVVAEASKAAAAAPAADGSVTLNPFASVLAPPPSPLLSLPCLPVPAPLLSNPHRVAFLSAVTAASQARTSALERRRRNALHGLESRRHTSALASTPDGGDALANGSAPRVFNEFERKMGRRLEGWCERDLCVEEGAWPPLTDEQLKAREQRAAEAEMGFRFFRARDNTAPMDTGAPAASASSHAAAAASSACPPAANDGSEDASGDADADAAAAAKRARKQARKEQRAREAAADNGVVGADMSTSAAAPAAGPTDAASPAAAAAEHPPVGDLSSAKSDEERAARKAAKRARKEAERAQKEGQQAEGGKADTAPAQPEPQEEQRHTKKHKRAHKEQTVS